MTLTEHLEELRVVFAQVFGRDNLSFRTRLFFFGRDFQIYGGPASTKPSSWAKFDWDRQSPKHFSLK